jgi:hypothetical protein
MRIETAEVARIYFAPRIALTLVLVGYTIGLVLPVTSDPKVVIGLLI